MMKIRKEAVENVDLDNTKMQHVGICPIFDFEFIVKKTALILIHCDILYSFAMNS